MAKEAAAAAAEQETMNPELWGNLQRHIGLENIYAKLPFRHFFQLRLVCKEWNRLASDAVFLNSTYKDFLLPEPYFVLDAEGPDGQVRGLLARDPRSNQWTWTRLPNWNEFWSVAGLALTTIRKGGYSRFVFNLHTRHLFLLPPPLEQTLQLRPFSGMEVDTAARPYQYKIMQGNDDVPTQIYDSRTNAWSAKPSHQYGMSAGRAIAAFAQGVLFIRCELDEIVIYDTAKDVWDGINPPPRHDSDDFLRGVGAWRDRIFHPSVDTKQKEIRVWELNNLADQQEWTEVATMPRELYSWLFYESIEPPVDSRDIQIFASYCFQWILIYAWLIDEENDTRDERLVIFDLETKKFRKLELPFGCLKEKGSSQGDLYAVW